MCVLLSQKVPKHEPLLGPQRSDLMAEFWFPVKAPSCAFVPFSSKAAKPSSAFHPARDHDHKSPCYFPSRSLFDSVDVFLLSPEAASCLFSLLPSLLLNQYLSLPFKNSPGVFLHTSHHTQAPLLFCAGAAGSFVMRVRREGGCSNSSPCLWSHSSSSFVCFYNHRAKKSAHSNTETTETR